MWTQDDATRGFFATVLRTRLEVRFRLETDFEAADGIRIERVLLNHLVPKHTGNLTG